jgi:hypothetical protein
MGSQRFITSGVEVAWSQESTWELWGASEDSVTRRFCDVSPISYLMIPSVASSFRWVTCHHGNMRPQVFSAGLRISSPDMQGSSLEQPSTGGPPVLGLGVGLITPCLK